MIFWKKFCFVAFGTRLTSLTFWIKRGQKWAFLSRFQSTTIWRLWGLKLWSLTDQSSKYVISI